MSYPYQAEIRNDIENIVTRVVSRLGFQIGNLTDSVVELKSDVSAIKSDIVELKSDVSELKPDVLNLKTGFTKLEQKIDTHISESRAEHKQIITMLSEDIIAVNNDTQAVKQAHFKHVAMYHQN